MYPFAGILSGKVHAIRRGILMRYSSHTIITHVVIKIWAFLTLCFMITLLYIFAAVMTGLIVNVAISLWPSSGNSAHIPALLLFSTCTAGLTYSYLVFYLKKRRYSLIGI